jgi:hypothetical protein
MSFFFNGREWVSPATMSAVDDTAMFDQNLSVGNRVAIIGPSEGGPPASILRFSRFGSPSQARDVLISGDSLKAIEKAFDPSGQTMGPSEVIFVRVNPATQSTLVLKDVGNADVITFTSEDYGLRTIGVKAKIESGTNAGYKLSTGFANDYYTADDVQRRAFSIIYAGANPTATLDVTGSTVVLTAATTINIDLTPLLSIGDLVDRINNVPGFTAAVLDGNESKPVLQALDGVTAQDVKSGTYTAKADLQAIVDWFNSAGEGFITATREGNALKVPVLMGWTYLAGGSDGTITNQSWQDALDVLQTIDCQWVVPVSSSAAVHHMVDSHVSYMSNIARKERRCLVGGAIGLTDAQAIAAAKEFNNDRTSYVHLGIYDYNRLGVLTLYSPYITAALLAGMFAGVNPGTALTNKAIKCSGLERNLRNPTDTDSLLLNGVLPIESTEEGYKVVQSISTWLINNNYNRREVSVGVAVDFMARNVRNALDALRGRKGTPLLLTEALSITKTALTELAKPEPMGPGVLVGDKANPAFKNITVSIDADVLRVEFQASPVIPINYIPIVIHAQPWRGTATLVG